MAHGSVLTRCTFPIRPASPTGLCQDLTSSAIEACVCAWYTAPPLRPICHLRSPLARPYSRASHHRPQCIHQTLLAVASYSLADLCPRQVLAVSSTLHAHALAGRFPSGPSFCISRNSTIDITYPFWQGTKGRLTMSSCWKFVDKPLALPLIFCLAQTLLLALARHSPP